MSRTFVAASTQYLENTNTPYSTPPFSISTWFYATATNARVFFCLGHNLLNHRVDLGYSLSVDSKVYAQLQDPIAGLVNIISTATLSLNAWHNAILIVNANNDHKLYTDGADLRTDATTVNPTPNTVELGILFAAGAYSNAWDGQIDECAMWNIALSTTDVANLQTQAPRIVQPANLVNQWRITGTDSPELDTTGSLPLTLVNGPTAGTSDPGLITSLANGRMFSVF